MPIIHPASLAATLDATDEALFFQKTIPVSVRKDVSDLLISRQIQSGSNAGCFIPFTAEAATESRLFSGERLNTAFASRHIQLIEAARLLKLLGMDDKATAKSIALAENHMNAMCYSKFCSKGECKSITVAYLRYLPTSDQKDSPAHINSLLTQLAAHRDEKGKWRGFPFFYTVLVLSEIDDPLAINEREYAAPVFQKPPGALLSTDPISRRRQAILARAFSRS